MVFMIITEFFLAILATLIFWTRIAVIENFIAAVKNEMSVKIWCNSRIVDWNLCRIPYVSFSTLLSLLYKDHYFKNSIFTCIFIIIKCDDDAAFIAIML